MSLIKTLPTSLHTRNCDYTLHETMCYENGAFKGMYQFWYEINKPNKKVNKIPMVRTKDKTFSFLASCGFDKDKTEQYLLEKLNKMDYIDDEI